LPNIKSAKKRVLISEIKTQRNKANKSALKTTIKKFDAAIAEGDKAAASTVYLTAVKAVDKAAAKGLMHKNTASRKKSSMARKVNALV